MSLKISKHLSIPDSEIAFSAIRSQGSGGQNVNKVASAIHLRFDIASSTLPENCRQRLLALKDKRITKEGVIVIKAQRFRDQEKNRDDALQRLQMLIRRAMAVPKKRIPSRPSRAADRRRLDAKTRQGRQKALRRRVVE